MWILSENLSGYQNGTEITEISDQYPFLMAS